MKDPWIERATLLLALAACVPAAGPAAAQAYPTKPIRFIAPYPPAGTSDILARIAGQKLADAWDQRVVVDNRPGASGSLGTEIGAKSAPDGYTLVLGSVAPIVLNPMFYPNIAYQSLRDFTPVSLIGRAPQLVVVNPSSPVKSVKDLIALAKSSKEGLNYGASGIGTLPHLGGEWFRVLTGTRMEHISYKGTILAIQDLLGGRLHVIFSDMPIALPLANSGKLRAIAVTGARRFPLTPDIPTATEAGLTGLVLDNWWGVLVVKGVARDIVGRINAALVRGLGQPDVKEIYTRLGLEAVTSTPQEFTDIIRSDAAKFSKLIKDAGITAH
ncbi:MAG: tripartite tricarboxylate transporter substrate binding protein [Burkholderiales bacterium]|nr:tripartite tricarboxylate transporter substrate binding protein [Burkholderiales bacterium]